jgi:hypothetical protein
MRPRLVLLACVMALAVVSRAGAAEWGLIEPGVSTTQTVRAQYGAPTRVEHEKVDNYDTEKWTYEGATAPAGVIRMTVGFGLLHDSKYRPELVRVLELTPHGSTFNRGIVTNGWGAPDRVGREGDSDVFLYKDGLLVYFAPDGWNVQLMVFTLPQPRDPTEERR